MREATLCFLIRGDPPESVLLGLKKNGFGAGKYNGFGGKIEPGETVRSAAARELKEESGVQIEAHDLHSAGHLTFIFPAKPEWDQIVHVFLARAWRGEPAESREMRPAWFRTDAIPFDDMWADDAYWLPRVLRGEAVRATFWYRADNASVDRVEFAAF